MSNIANGVAITVCLGIACTAMVAGYRRIRAVRLSTLPPFEQFTLALMAISAAGVFAQVGFHGQLFGCIFAGCRSTATVSLTSYTLALVAQPISDWMRRRKWRSRDYLAWLLAGTVMILIAYVAGKGYFHFYYLWSRGLPATDQ